MLLLLLLLVCLREVLVMVVRGGHRVEVMLLKVRMVTVLNAVQVVVVVVVGVWRRG